VSDSDSDKTEDATPERRRKAREEGQFPRAKDTGALAATIAILITVSSMGGGFWDMLRAFTRRCFSEGLTFKGSGIDYIARELATLLLAATLPLAGVAAVAGTLAGFAEAGFHPNLDLAAPKFERLNPISKLGQMFSPKAALTNITLSLLRVAVVAWVAYSIVKTDFPQLARLSRAPVGVAVAQVFTVLARLALWSTIALLVLAGVDYVTSWFRHESQIKMSLQEVKDEHKSQEGSPQVKARQRARARELLKRGIRKGVKEATVIITNPTHIAIAIRYRVAEGAPVVTAKGFDEVAQHIKQLARDYDVPVIENKPLARALAAKVKVGKVIPVELFVAVAEVLAFVFRLRKRGLRA
jgi:flagellar biosynthetic protein FlhB